MIKLKSLLYENSPKIYKIGQSLDTTESDIPIEWNAIDVQMLHKWDIPTIKQFLNLPDKFQAIYRAIINVDELEENIKDINDYDWSELSYIKRGIPPIVIARYKNENIKILDGNHRVYFAKQNNYNTIGAWVVDYLIQAEIDKSKIAESFIYKQRDIIVGIINRKTKKIYASDTYLTHHYLITKHPDVNSWNEDDAYSWRYNKLNKTLYWWDKKVPLELYMLVQKYLLKIGYVIEENKYILWGEHDKEGTYKHSHGIN